MESLNYKQHNTSRDQKVKIPYAIGMKKGRLFFWSILYDMKRNVV